MAIRTRGFLPSVLVLVIAACRDTLPTETEHPVFQAYVRDRGQAGMELIRFPEMAERLEDVLVDRSNLPQLESDGDLVENVRRSGGVVHIGFKQPSRAPTRVTGIVPGLTRGEALEYRSQVTSLGAELTQTFRNLSAIVARIPPELAPVLRALPFVNYVEAETYLYPGDLVGALQHTTRQETIQRTAMIGDSTGQDTSWGARLIGAPDAWYLGFQGQNTTITIIDSGIDPDHRNTAGRDGPANNITGDCLYVASAINTCWQTTPVHGSHVSGIASARDNTQGWIGIAPTPSRTASVRVISENGNAPHAAIASAIDWTVSNGYAHQVVNLSLQGCNSNSTVATAIADSWGAGNILVSIAGNVLSGFDCGGSIGTTDVTYPGRYSNIGIIAVSGTTPSDAFAVAANNPCPVQSGFGSRFGDRVFLSAPFWDSSMVSNGNWGPNCGTSMAAPKVTALAALLWSWHQSWSNYDILVRMCETAVKNLGDGEHFGCGRISATNAFGPADELSVSISGSSQVPYYQTCYWEAQVSGGYPPYSYSWSGVLSGGGASVSGADVSGTLYLTVSSGDEQEDGASMSISPTEEGSC